MGNQNDDDEINQPAPEPCGYKRPPRQHQFKKGQSGNIWGRPPKMERSNSELQQALDALEIIFEPVKVRINGKTRKVSAWAATVIKTRQMALDGDLKAQKQLADITSRSIRDLRRARPELYKLLDDYESRFSMNPSQDEGFLMHALNRARQRTGQIDPPKPTDQNQYRGIPAKPKKQHRD